jgi:hypothetical protein
MAARIYIILFLFSKFLLQQVSLDEIIDIAV